MFRNSLRRCANQARTAASASLLSQCRTVVPVARRQIAPAKTLAPISKLASFARLYSTEAAVQNDTAEISTPEEVTRFDDLQGIDQGLLKTITQGMGYETMTPVQAKTITPALKGTDIVAQAKTGTGKTIAFLLPLLQRMIVEDPTLAQRGARRMASSDDIRGIVLSPTRELAEQIAHEARALVRNTGLVVQCAVGGTDKRSMLSRTRREGCHLLIATPGRLNDLLQDPRSGIEAPNLAALVLDEADRMLDVGFERELNEIVEALPRAEDKVRQTMLVSATIPDNVIRLARSMVRPQDFEFVQTISENESLTHDKVPQHIVPTAGWANVFPSLFELIENEAAKAKEDPTLRPFKAIVYLNTTALVELCAEMGYQRGRNATGTPVATYSIQSKLTQQQRQKAADTFKRAKSGVLFSSDVTARGMDFPDVTHVIQVDTPRDRESYIHRLGRTGRQNKEGEGWLILPASSVSGARKLLRGLPLKQNTELTSAETDLAAGESTEATNAAKELISMMPRRLLSTTYMSMFGMAADKISLAEELNEWTKYGWGWEQPPAVSHSWARKMGISRVNSMNYMADGEREDGEAASGRYNSREANSYGSRGSFNGGRDRGDRRESSDPFKAMAYNARSDRGDRGDRGQGRGGRRGGSSGSRSGSSGPRGYGSGSSW